MMLKKTFFISTEMQHGSSKGLLVNGDNEEKMTVCEE
uniref:Bm1462 n=1 Tax=Brugia malayi TaxID=6279 RepID=A0A1I9G439_BRUMA|nr:Bm1462 [Brugia malayi]